MKVSGFYVLMALASVFGFLKFFVLADFLTPADFAYYAAFFASVRFIAELTAFGGVDVTIKRFPRLVFHGRTSEIWTEATAKLWHLMGRYAVVFAVLWAGLAYVEQPQPLIVASALTAMAIATNLFSLTASSFRALGALITLGGSAALRAMAVFAAILLLSSPGWHRILAIESIVLFVVSVLALLVVRSLVYRHATAAPGAPSEAEKQDQVISKAGDAPLLFFGFFMALLPITLDRSFVVYFEPTSVSGLYTFCAIWTAAALTVIGIYSQKIGPEIVGRRAAGELTDPAGFILKRLAMLAGILGIGAVLSFCAIWLVLYDAYWVKYELTVPIAFLASLVAAVQATLIFDWVLIALDGEKRLIQSSTIFLTIFALGFVLTAALGFGYAGYAISVIAARLAQMSWQIRSVLLLTRAG